MPYAYGAKISHEFDTDHLNIWLTFRFPMRRSSDPLDEPEVFDIMPPLDLWIVKVDNVEKAVTASEWQDEFTLLLTVPDVASMPARVFVEYKGPNANLEICWRKQWEPWGPKYSHNVSA
jgi:hypothetical protein